MTLDLFAAASVVCVAWLQHTPESAQGSEDIKDALKETGLLNKQAAPVMRITEPELSRQLAGRESLSYWRLLSLPVTFQIARIKREAARYGLTVLTPHERELMLGAARLGRRRMARMFPHFMSERRVS